MHPRPQKVTQHKRRLILFYMTLSNEDRTVLDSRNLEEWLVAHCFEDSALEEEIDTPVEIFYPYF